LIFSNPITRNLEFCLSTLYTKSQNPKAVTLQNDYVALLFDQNKGLSKEVWARQEWKPKQ